MDAELPGELGDAFGIEHREIVVATDPSRPELGRKLGSDPPNRLQIVSVGATRAAELSLQSALGVLRRVKIHLNGGVARLEGSDLVFGGSQSLPCGFELLSRFVQSPRLLGELLL